MIAAASHSSSSVMEQVGPKTLFSKSRDFGFGSKTGISLNGEVTGKLKKHTEWSAVSLGMIAMGHEVAVTAIQLAVAYSSIANGGYLLKPLIVNQIMAPEGSIVYDEEPIVARKIADTVSMKNIREMLRNVITKGTGQNAKIAGWQVAGKTGTAQKWKDGDYSDDKFISNPKFPL